MIKKLMLAVALAAWGIGHAAQAQDTDQIGISMGKAVGYVTAWVPLLNFTPGWIDISAERSASPADIGVIPLFLFATAPELLSNCYLYDEEGIPRGLPDGNLNGEVIHSGVVPFVFDPPLRIEKGTRLRLWIRQDVRKIPFHTFIWGLLPETLDFLRIQSATPVGVLLFPGDSTALHMVPSPHFD